MARKSKNNPYGLDKKYYVLDSSNQSVVFESDDFYEACNELKKCVYYMVFARKDK